MPGTVGIGGFPYTLSGEVPDMPAITLAQAQRLADILDPVPTIADLPASGNWIGRTKVVQSYPGAEFQWNGTAWKLQGEIVFANYGALTSFMGTPANVAVLRSGSRAWISDIGQPMSYTGTAWNFSSASFPITPSSATQTGGSTAGIVIGSDGWTELTNVSEVLLQDVFPTFAKAFEVEYDLNGSTNAAVIQAQLMVGASPTTSGYFYHTSYGSGGTQVNNDISNTAAFSVNDLGSTNYGAGFFRLYGVNDATRVKQIVSPWSRINSAGTAAASGLLTGWQGTGTNVYTGLRFFVTGSNFVKARVRVRALI